MKFVVRIQCMVCDVETDTTADVRLEDDGITHTRPRIEAKADLPDGWERVKMYDWFEDEYKCPECLELAELSKDTPD